MGGWTDRFRVVTFTWFNDRRIGVNIVEFGKDEVGEGFTLPGVCGKEGIECVTIACVDLLRTG